MPEYSVQFLLGEFRTIRSASTITILAFKWLFK